MLMGLVQGFGSNPSMTGRALREFGDRAPQRFVEEALQILKEDLPEPGRKFLVGILMERDILLKSLADPKVFDREKALELSLVVHRTYPMMESQLLRLSLQDITGPGSGTGEDANWENLNRTLDILGHVGATLRVMPILTNLLRSSNAFIRSKAAPLIIRTIRNPQWLRDLVLDEDPRVRSNAVEAFLTVTPLPEERETLRKMVSDPNHRVAATTLVVLHLHGEQETTEERLLEMSGHADPLFRASAAWAMGKTGNPRFLADLQRMVREETGDVKRMAFLSCVSLRKEKPAATTNEAA
jgi:hypothetical protein